jgi:3-isopropylmalate/(R)-2-methylmalate dehydratase large subunit
MVEKLVIEVKQMVIGKKILARAANVMKVKSKETIQVAVDYCIINDAVSNLSIDYLRDQDSIFDKNKVAVIIDHDTPSGSEAVSIIQRKLINFAKKYDTVYHEGEGVGYQIMLDHYVKDGQIIVGCGEHIAVFGAIGAIGFKISPGRLAEAVKNGVLEMEVPQFIKIEFSGELSPGVYAKDIILHVIKDIGTKKIAGKMLEFTGYALRSFTFNDRITICNLAGKTNVVSAVVNLSEVSKNDDYEASYQYDLGLVKPSIATPDSYDNILEVNQVGNVKVNEVFIGGCSGGRIEDLRLAAKILRGRKVAKGVRLMVAPITSSVYVQALREGLITEFIDAGAVVMNQGCSVCWGKSQGIIDTDEVLVSAGSFNCMGCAGAKNAKIYISSAATAAESSITGVISEASTR